MEVGADRPDNDLAGIQADADANSDALHPPHLVGVLLHGLLHPECGVASADGVVLMGQRCAEERHDPVAHHLVHRALVAMHGLHHVFEHGVEELARLFRVAIREQLHRAFQVGEEHGDLLPLALQRGLGGEDLLGEMFRCVRLGGSGEQPAGLVIGAAHCPQNLFAGGLAAPHDGHTDPKGVAHSPQNFMPAGFSCWQRGHCMQALPACRLPTGYGELSLTQSGGQCRRPRRRLDRWEQVEATLKVADR